MRLSLNTTSGKILATAALLGTTAAVAGLGTYGGFTSSTSASASVADGTMNIDVNASGGTTNLQVAATGLIPGDKVQRLITLANTGTTDLSALTLTTSAAAPTSVLTSDTANGLQLTVQSCDQVWSAVTGGGYSCGGTATTVLASTPVITTTALPSSLKSLTHGQSDNLMITETLPGTAGDGFQGVSSTVNFSFTATQRSAVTK